MPTLTFVCGFDEGNYTDGPAPSSHHQAGSHYWTDDGELVSGSFNAANARNGGRYALRFTGLGAVHYAQFSTQTHLGSMWVRWDGLSDSGSKVFNYGGTIVFGLTSGGTPYMTAGGGSALGTAAIGSATWHRVDWYANTSANPTVVQWQINGTAQTNATFATSAYTLGEFSWAADTGADIYYDDCVFSQTPGDYPLGPYTVRYGTPISDGSHNVGSGAFKDQSNNAITGATTSSYSLVADPPSQSTFVQQTAADTTAYLEWVLTQQTSTDDIDGVYVAFALKGAGGFIDTSRAKMLIDGSEDTVWADYNDSNGFIPRWKFYAARPSTAAWDLASLNAMRARFGYYDIDLGAQQLCDVWYEAAFADDTGGGGGTATTELSDVGVWIDWGRDGFACGTAVSSSSDGGLLRLIAEGSNSGGTAAICDNITTDVLSLEWHRGSGPDHTGSSNPGEAVIVVDNTSQRYSPDNTASDLYGLLAPGLPVWFGVNADGTMLTAGTAIYGLFGGYVREIVPTPVDGSSAYCEILCEDALGRYGRAAVSVEPSLVRSQQDLREAILDDANEAVGRRILDDEPSMLFFSSEDTTNALTSLDELNRASATRHWIAPADVRDHWYDYSTANRLYKVLDAEDESIDGDNVDAITGYRVTEENVLNYQRAQVTPLSLGLATTVVWTYGQVPFTVTAAESRIIWANFDDYVFNAAIQANVNSGSITTAITNFGQTAKLEITTSSTAVVRSLVVTGQLIHRGDTESVISQDFSSQARYQIRAGSDITSDWAGQTGAAQGLVDFLVWKFAAPLKRPSIAIAGKSAATKLTIFQRDLYDVITLSVDRLSVVNRRFEIVGLSGSYKASEPVWRITYELQETRNQTALDYFIVDTDSVDGAKLIAPF